MRAALATVGVALLLSACATPGTDSARGLAGSQYVALGSSFASGPMIPPLKPSDPPRCARSQANYATLVAARFGLSLIDRTCSGATTEHVLGPWNEIPAQIEALTPETRLVTLTIGGNDVGYIGNLFAATCAGDPTFLKGGPCFKLKQPTQADFARTEESIRTAVTRIKAAAPHARIMLVQYLNPLPRAGALCAATPVSEAAASLARETGARLAAIVARIGRSEGADVIAMDTASQGHSPCDAEPWTTGAPRGYDGRDGMQWHPNKRGMQATAEAIATRLTTSKMPRAR